MTRIEEIVDEFMSMESDFRLELMLDYADRLPALPERLQNQEDIESHQVHECQTPVALWVEVKGEKVNIYAEVPQESPTVRGFISMIIYAFNGATVQEVLDSPADILDHSGLAQTIGMRRMFGLSAIYTRIKQEVAEKANIIQ
jgi:cysteine desulfuration protein SufE